MKKILLFLFIAISSNVFAQNEGYKVGDVVKDFKLKNVDGKMVSMADYPNAKGFVIVFTCNTCPYAIVYQDRIIALNKEYTAKGYPVIAINPNDPIAQPADSYEKMQQRAKEKKFTFPYLMDPDHIHTKLFGANRTPHTFIVEKTSRGSVVRYIGAIDDDTEGNNLNKQKYAENALNSLLKGELPSLTFTKAVGCTIKWKAGTVE